MRFLFVAAVVLTVGCGESAADRATRYLQAAEEVKIEEARLGQLVDLHKQNIEILRLMQQDVEATAKMLQSSTMSDVTKITYDPTLTDAEKEQRKKETIEAGVSEAKKAGEKTLAEITAMQPQIEKVKSDIAAQQLVVDAAIRRRDAFSAAK